MSRSRARSYRNDTVFSVGKRKFNRKLRRLQVEIPSGGAYKKFFEPYNICETGSAQPISKLKDKDLAEELRRK